MPTPVPLSLKTNGRVMSPTPDRSQLENGRNTFSGEKADESTFIKLTEPPQPASQNSPSPTESAEIPNWFQKKRAKQKASRKQRQQVPSLSHSSPQKKRRKRQLHNKGPAIASTLLQTKFPWTARWSRRVLKFFAAGYGISLLFHALLLTVLSVILIHKSEDKPFSLLASHSDQESTEFQEIVDTRTDLPSPEMQVDMPAMNSIETIQTDAQQTVAAPELDSLATSALGEGDEESGEGTGHMFSMPDSGKVVSKGSFTAWTVPEDPKPGHKYLIIIQVKLPERIRKYPRRDLSGMVVGTDGYEQRIPRSKHGYLPIKQHVAQLKVRVPGAEEKVRDTIVIRSRRLKEQQTLKIVF